ncbi:NAD(P)-binding protein [Rhizoclosmatium globosum]|uniref:NAD(P)-binding protein n=1 Tax=Rhizoclosmatium globosum TaxID=329046 RepID=A0A1Y2D2R1_9FUNG|nr:NAD(P)-binding protein [Rhizoclosmatium globosum]|eukprot:ORY53487.1 NAD(P)-binding protein [Rhizoclosmatium globosum]
MTTLYGQTCVVIGATTSVGLSAAQQLRGRGAHVVLTGGQNVDDAAVAVFGVSPTPPPASNPGSPTPTPTVSARAVPVTSADAVAQLFADLNRVDHVVVALSPSVAPASVASLSADDLDAQFAAHVGLAFAVVQTAAKHVRKTTSDSAPSITLVSSSASRGPQKGNLAAAVVAAALDSLVRSLAVELSPIRVNAISTGNADAQSDDSGEAIAFLVASSFTTGQILAVDGGFRH